MKARAILIRGVVVAAMAAGAVTLVGAPAQALPRNVCQDLYNKIDAELTAASNWYDLSVAYTAMGLAALARNAMEKSNAYAEMASNHFDLAYDWGC